MIQVSTHTYDSIYDALWDNTILQNAILGWWEKAVLKAIPQAKALGYDTDDDVDYIDSDDDREVTEMLNLALDSWEKWNEADNACAIQFEEAYLQREEAYLQFIEQDYDEDR